MLPSLVVDFHRQLSSAEGCSAAVFSKESGAQLLKWVESLQTQQLCWLSEQLLAKARLLILDTSAETVQIPAEFDRTLAQQALQLRSHSARSSAPRARGESVAAAAADTQRLFAVEDSAHSGSEDPFEVKRLFKEGSFTCIY